MAKTETDMNQIRLESLNRNRQEVRFTGTGAPQLNDSSEIREISYSDNIVTSLYFDSPKYASERCSVRFRYRSATRPSHDLFVFDMKQKGSLEVKVRGHHHQGNGEQVKKYTINNITIEEAMTTLGNKDNLTNLEKYPQGNHIRKVLEILYKGEKLKPLLMTQAERRHVIIPSQAVRMTLDSGTSYWLPNVDRSVFYNDGVFFARRVETMLFNVLEIKKERDNGSVPPGYYHKLVADLFGENNDYTIGDRLKRSLGIDIFLQYGQPVRINPERKIENDAFKKTEREHKIDLSADPRQIVEELSIDDTDIYLGPTKPIPVYIRYIKISPTAFVVHKSLQPDFDPTVSVYQYKTPITQDNVLVRSKNTTRTWEEIVALIGEKNIQGTLQRTTIGKRDRVERTAVCADTGNIFAILGDHCTAEDGRTPLEQIEIEYLGKLDFPNKPGAPSDPEEKARDFAKIEQIVLNSLNKKNISPLSSQTEKGRWLST